MKNGLQVTRSGLERWGEAISGFSVGTMEAFPQSAAIVIQGNDSIDIYRKDFRLLGDGLYAEGKEKDVSDYMKVW